ncbi:MAG: hypothetical protein QXS76_01795 [Candidatus Bathyarchaeia archaeon]
MAGEKMFFVPRGGADLRRWLKDVEQRYSDAFAEVGPGALMDLKRMIDAVDAFLDLLADERVDFRVKLVDYVKVRDDVFEFCRFYARFLGASLAERLRAEIYQLMEEAISWWFQELEVEGW